MENAELIQDLNRSWNLELSPKLTISELERVLAELFNAMIRDDFSGLVQLLYRIDVSEKKLRSLLAAAGGGGQDTGVVMDAGNIIARLVIERQFEKIETRRRYRQKDVDIPDEEKW